MQELRLFLRSPVIHCQAGSAGRPGPGDPGGRCYPSAVRRPVIALGVALVAIAVFVGGLAWLLDQPKPPPDASEGERLYYAYCATCHGTDGRGSWRAALFVIHPGNLAEGARMRQHSDQYLFDIIKHGGAPLGRPGMPAFGFHVSDDGIKLLVSYVRSLARDG